MKRRIAIQRLVLISGPVASGKSTLAEALAHLARESGASAAAIDMDELTTMIAGHDWSLITPAQRRLACELAAAVTDRVFDGGYTFVAIAGSTLSAGEWNEMLRHLNAPPPTTRVLLRVSVGEAVRRAQADATRGATSDPRVVAALHAQIDWSHVPPADVEVDTDHLPADDVAAAVWSLLRGPSGS